MPDVQQILADPKFQALPPPEQVKVLGSVDPKFGGLPAEEQAKVLDHFLGQRQVDATAGPAVQQLAPQTGPEDRAAAAQEVGMALSQVGGAAAGTTLGALTSPVTGPAGPVLGAAGGAALGTQLGSMAFRGDWASFWETAASGALAAAPEALNQGLLLTGRGKLALDQEIQKTSGASIPNGAADRLALADRQQTEGLAVRDTYNTKALPRIERIRAANYEDFYKATDTQGTRIDPSPELLEKAQIARTNVNQILNPTNDPKMVTKLDSLVQRLSEPRMLTPREVGKYVQEIRDTLPNSVPITNRDFVVGQLSDMKKTLENAIDLSVENTPAQQLLTKAKTYMKTDVFPARAAGKALNTGTLEDASQYITVLKQQPNRFATVLRNIDIVDPSTAQAMRVAYAQDLVSKSTDELGVVNYGKLGKAFQTPETGGETSPVVRNVVTQGNAASYNRLLTNLDRFARMQKFAEVSKRIATGGEYAAGGAAVLDGINELRKGNVIKGTLVLTGGIAGVKFLPRLLADPTAVRLFDRGMRAEDLGKTRTAFVLGTQLLTHLGLQGAIGPMTPETPAPIATPNPEPAP